MPTTTAFTFHDHAACVASALATADAECARRGLQLTPIRRRVLEILLESHVALGAYDLLPRLKADGFSAQPPVAYRALAFLIKAGFAHRIEGLNAFVACSRPGQAHDPAFMICRTCRRVAEDLAPARLSSGTDARGFRIEHSVVEAMGRCPACQEDAA